MISSAPKPGVAPRALSPSDWAPEVSLQGRLVAVRRRRLALRMRDWFGIGIIATFSVTLFAVTFLSLVGR